MRGSRRQLLTAGFGLWAARGSLSRAQDRFPSKPIRIIVPLPAGGAVDVGTRILVEPLQAILKQQIIVENKPGGVYAIGMQAMAQAAPDGYTLHAINTSHVSTQLVLKRYDMVKQLAPISTWSRVDTILTASPQAPFGTVKEMIDWGRANPRKLNYGSIGPGTLEHLEMDEVMRRYGIEATHVPFKGGPDAMATLIQGDIQLFPAVIPLVNQFKGKVRTLALLNNERSALAPEVPTIREVGLDVPAFQFWNGLAAPAGTPPEVIQTLERGIGQALAGDVTKSKLAGIGMIASASTAAGFAKTIDDDFKWLGEAVRVADIKLN